MTDTTNNKKEYLETKVKPILDKLVFQLLCEHPENPASYMIDWLKKKILFKWINIKRKRGIRASSKRHNLL